MDDTTELAMHLFWLEDALTGRIPGSLARSQLIRPLRDLYATRSASAILTCVQAALPPNTLVVPQTEDMAGQAVSSTERPAVTPLLRPESIKRAAGRLRSALRIGDESAILEALLSLGVFDLFPSPETAVARLERACMQLFGTARMLAMVELAVYAAELGINKTAARCVAEANALDPGRGELHDLYSVAGSIAMNEQRITDAVRDLIRSVSVADENEPSHHDEFILRGLNLMLARKLLAVGQKEAVRRFLKSCKRVWQEEHIVNRLESWITQLDGGEIPDLILPLPSPLARPSRRIILLAGVDELCRINPIS